MKSSIGYNTEFNVSKLKIIGLTHGQVIASVQVLLKSGVLSHVENKSGYYIFNSASDDSSIIS